MGKRFVYSLLAIILYSPVFSQNIAELLQKGDRYFSKKDFANALDSYKKAVNLSPDDPDSNFKLGITYLHTEAKKKSLPFLEKAYSLKPDVDKDIDYHLGMAYQYDHQYVKAKDHYVAFGQKNKKLSYIAQHKIEECMMGDSLVQNPRYVIIENAGPAVNSTFHEYSPILSADGNTMIFTSNRSIEDNEKNHFEDIYITTKSGNTWNTPQKISPNINIKFHDAAASLSADGKLLFLYYEEGAGDIYTSALHNGEWSKPEPLNKNINTPLFWETSASISADGKKLFFTSNRPGGKGELDIYMSELDNNGTWGKAVNLGTQINTPANEDAPFIHPDGVTLYFSSDGHPTMGSNDIFKSEFKDGKWSKPVNLGYPINSIEYDGFFSMSADKKTAYYSTIREDGMGDADIYTVRFLDPPARTDEPVLMASTKPAIDEQQSQSDDYVDPIIQVYKDNKVATILKGKVIDEITSAPLSAVITLIDNENQRVVSKINAGINGEFELVVPHGGNYGVATERSGYLFNSINFNVPQFADYQEIDMHIMMAKAQVGSKIVLKNIFFNVNKSDLKSESLSEVEKIYNLLISNPQLKMQVNGHTDNTGNASANKALSLKRAEAVVRYLVEKGIAADRLLAKGFGSERPLVSNDDEEEGREINRRTELEVIEQ